MKYSFLLSQARLTSYVFPSTFIGMKPEILLQPKMEPEDDAAHLRRRDLDSYYGNYREEDTVFSSNGLRNNDHGANNMSCTHRKSWMENGDVSSDDTSRYSRQQQQPQLLHNQQEPAGVYRRGNVRAKQESHEEEKRVFRNNSFSNGGYKDNKNKTANTFDEITPRTKNNMPNEKTLVDDTGTQLHRGVHGKIAAEKKRMRLPPNKSDDFANNDSHNSIDLGDANTPPAPIPKALKASRISPSPPSHNGKDHTSSGNSNIHCNGTSNTFARKTGAKAPLVEPSGIYKNGINRDCNVSGSSSSSHRTRQLTKSFDKRSLIELPSSHTSCSKFPPGCPVVCTYHADVPISLDNHQNNRIKSNVPDILRNGTDAKIRMGKVQCVYVNLSSSTRELVHLVARRRGNGLEGGNSEELLYVEEGALAYAPQCPVVYTPKSNIVRDGYDDGVGVGGVDNRNVAGVNAMKGIVLLCRQMRGDPVTGEGQGHHDKCDNHRSKRFVYTILLKLPGDDEGHWIKENVEQEEISFRAPVKNVKERVVVDDDNNSVVKGGQGGKCIEGKAGIDNAEAEAMRKMGNEDATDTSSGDTRQLRENSVGNEVTNDESCNGSGFFGDGEAPVSVDGGTRRNEEAPAHQHQSNASKEKSFTTKEKEVPHKPRDGKEVQETVIQKSSIASANLQRYPQEKGDVDSINNCSGNSNPPRYTTEERPPSSVTQLQNKPNHTTSTTNGNTKVFVINLRKSDKRFDLQNFFSSYGKILSLDFPLIPPGKHKCFATIEFESPESTAAVVRKNSHSYFGRKIYSVYYKQRNLELESGGVKFHDEGSNDYTDDMNGRVIKEDRERNNGNGSNNCNNKIFISYLRRSDDNEDIEDYFSNFGTVVKFSRFPKRCNLGIVEFECSESAAAAEEKSEHILNGHEIFVKYHKAKGQTLRNDYNMMTSIDIPIDDYLSEDDESEFGNTTDDGNRFCRTYSVLDKPLSKKRCSADEKRLGSNSSNKRQRLESTGSSTHDVARRWVPPNRSS